jgi:hypothetical protein
MKTVMASCDLSRMLPALTGPLAEETATNTLLGLLAVAVDTAALHGTGADGQPTGIENVSGVDSRTGASFALATATAMLKAIEDANGEATAWISSPGAASILRQRERATGSGLLIEDGKMMGLPVLVTNAAASGYLFVGDFRELVVLSRALEILSNPYSQRKPGLIEVTLFHHLDIVVRHPAYFAVATAVT